MRTLFIVVLAAAPACTSTPAVSGDLGDPSDPSDPSDPAAAGLTPDAELPRASGVFAGTYRVPTDPSLASAATFPVDSVDWTVVGDAVTLHYNLPAGLVGGTVPVTMTGTIAANGTQIAISGAAGAGVCVASATLVTCHEVFGDLGPLPVSTDVVARVAGHEYAGPVADRLNVAAVFGSDPIGFIDIDLTTPVIDDHGGGGGGGGHDDP